MKYNFDIWASHENNGNMKGSWAKNMPADGIMLSSAEMDYPLPEFIQALCPILRQTDCSVLHFLTGTTKVQSERQRN